MLHWLEAPKTDIVATFIECYWLIEKKPGEQRFEFPMLNPDPCAHLIISPDNQTYHYQHDETALRGKGCHLLFPHRTPLQLDHRKPFIHLGIKFKTGALYSVDIDPIGAGSMNLNLDKIQDIDLASILAINDVNTDELLELARKNQQKCCQFLDALLLPWLSKAQQDRHAKLAFKAVELLDTTPIGDLANKLHCTQRTLERAFSKVTGLTLKQCQSMLKLEAMLEYLYQRTSAQINWPDVAYKFGFSDQPHLVRYLKSQLGLTPNTYAKQRCLTIDAYGGINAGAK